MKKPVSNIHPIHDLLKHRWSPRAFSDQMVEKDKILSLLEAARWAPSSFNEQPWYFIIATKDNPKEYEKLLNCLVDGNIRWAKNAPALMISVAKIKFDRTGKLNRHAFHDLGLATAHLVMQATHLGLYAHQMAGIHIDNIREEYQIPPDHEPVVGIAIGYYGNLNQLQDNLKEKEVAVRIRRPLNAFVFSGIWNNPSYLLYEATEQSI